MAGVCRQNWKTKRNIQKKICIFLAGLPENYDHLEMREKKKFFWLVDPRRIKTPSRLNGLFTGFSLRTNQNSHVLYISPTPFKTHYHIWLVGLFIGKMFAPVKMFSIVIVIMVMVMVVVVVHQMNCI